MATQFYKGDAVEVFGIDEVTAELKGFQFSATAEIRDAVSKAALKLQRNAKVFCPVDTGRLRASIGLRFYQNGMTAEVGTNVNYAAAIEYGSRGRRAQAFLGPAFDIAAAQLLVDVRAAIAKAAA